MQEVDSERRIQALRGIAIDPLPQVTDEHVNSTVRRDEGGSRVGRELKRRKLDGEDDTDRDIRLALQNQNAGAPAQAEAHTVKTAKTDAPLTDGGGHINLFPVEGSRHHASKNPEAQAEAEKKKREFEDQYTMRFSNAAGFKQAIGENPWYHPSKGNGEGGPGEEVGKNVWGNEDPRRKERAQMRVVADDPLAAMQKGVQGLRHVERERKKWSDERELQLREFAEEERRRHKRKNRRRHADDLAGFSLDAQSDDEGDGRHQRRRPSKHRSRHQCSGSDSISRHSSCQHGGSRADGRSRSPGRDRSDHTEHGRKRRTRVGDIPGWEAGPGGRYSSQFGQVAS